MVVLNYTGGEVNAKIVYYGPGLSGKTTNLEFIHDRTPEGSRGKMVSMKTQTDRTLFFDFLPLELGEINGYRTRFLLYTVPGQVYYNATRKLVLKGVDAVVFVADSSRSKLDENLESLRNLEQNLNEHGMSLDELPWVIQYNKRDAADAMAVADLDARLNPLRVPSSEAVATQGTGVYETFHSIATLVYRVLKDRLERELESVPSTPSAPPAGPRSAAPGRRDVHTAPASGEVEFDSAIDSMLREMDAPSRPAAPPAVPAPPASVQGTVNMSAAAPVTPHVPAAPAPQPAATPVPRASAPVASQPAAGVQTEDRRSSPRPAPSVFDRAPEAFDLELGRLPALEDAAFASENARDEGPNEFVTDPMRRAPAKESNSAPARVEPRVEPRVEAPIETRIESPVDLPVEPAADAAPAPAVVHVPVVLTRAQARPGAQLRVVLDIRVADE
jgi:signal recognition particle receptor subunit beta